MESVAGFMEKGKKNSLISWWKIREQSISQGSEKGRGDAWEVLRIGAKRRKTARGSLQGAVREGSQWFEMVLSEAQESTEVSG